MRTEAQDDDAPLTAADWFARLKSPECTAAERESFRRWQAHPDNAAAYAATEHLWTDLGSAAAREGLGDAIAAVLAATDPAHRRPARRSTRSLWLALAAVLVVSVIVGVVLRQPDPALPPQAYATAFGETRTIMLEDGSELMLNSASEVSVQMSPKLRSLVLLQGEVLFSVKPESARPFLVRAGNSEVNVTGTRFVVRRETAETVVTLLSGRVVVADPEVAVPMTLTPGEELRVAAGGAVQRRKVDTGVASAWTRGRLLFRATPLATAVDEINRYVNPKLRLDDPGLAEMTISGSVRVGSSAAVAEALAFLLPLKIETAENGDLLLQASDTAAQKSTKTADLSPEKK